MADRDVVVTDGGGGSAMGMILGIILGVILLLGVLFFSGAFNKMFGPKDTKIDVDISAPKAP
jgi:hypothetical protein